MITIHVTDLEGTTHEILAPTDMGFNVMEAIRANELPIKATCGGTVSYTHLTLPTTPYV